MATLNETPNSNRLHIGIFGKTNSGKSSFINALTGQSVSIVSEVAGTTTDPVYKAMEINPIGPCVIIDTAGFDDDGVLGEQRMEKTKLAAKKTDIAVIVFSAEELVKKTDIDADNSDSILDDAFKNERNWYKYFCDKHTPVVVIVNKMDMVSSFCEEDYLGNRAKDVLLTKEEGVLVISTKTGHNMDKVKASLTRALPEDYGNESITGALVQKGDLVLLVMPQDIQAPKGRLILPQVQTIRELLDKKAHVVSVTTDEMVNVFAVLNKPPKLIITDSQVFDYVYNNKPKESLLTSFSVLFAALKGDISYYMEGAKAIESLTENSKVLIAECCTHAPLGEDIGRVKIPNMLRKRFGAGLSIDIVSGTDFPDKLNQYDLIIQCGACMFNRKYVLSRIEHARENNVPMTNYGITIAHITGILEHVVIPDC